MERGVIMCDANDFYSLPESKDVGDILVYTPPKPSTSAEEDLLQSYVCDVPPPVNYPNDSK